MSGRGLILLAFSCVVVISVNCDTTTPAGSSTPPPTTTPGPTTTTAEPTTTRPATTTTRWVQYPCDTDDDCIPPDQCIVFRESDASRECTDPDFETAEIFQGGRRRKRSMRK